MTLVPAKCPECGGNVVVDNEKDAWICDFCKTPFIVDKAIQTFNTTYNTTNVSNVTNNNDIKADVVNVYESKASDFVIKAGELVEYNGKSMDVVIPDEVVAINKETFAETKIHSIVINDNVEEIGSFLGCDRLTDIVLPEGIEIIPESFANGCVSLKAIELPKSLKYIGNFAFANCLELETITIPANVEYIGICAFDNCEKLKTVVIEKYDNIYINASAFAGTPNNGGNVVKTIVKRIEEEVRRREEEEEQQKEQEKREEWERIKKQAEEREAKEWELGKKVFEERMMKGYVEKKTGDNKTCPICKRPTVNIFGRCIYSHCPTKGKKRSYFARIAIERVNLGRCPSCGAPLKVLRGYEDSKGNLHLEIQCSTFKLECEYACKFAQRIRI